MKLKIRDESGVELLIPKKSCSHLRKNMHKKRGGRVVVKIRERVLLMR